MAQGFGSKADMLSSKLDEVSKITIWREHCTKELSETKLITDFQITNPLPSCYHPSRRAGLVLPPKPNATVPVDRVEVADFKAAGSYLKQVNSIKNAHKTAPEKFVLPQTSSQEYGWDARQLVEPSEMFHKTRSSCDITLYADHYYFMLGTTPFSRRDMPTSQ